MREDIKQLLTRVSKPGRYTGGEQNSVIKDKASLDLRVAFCFPDTYEIGMSNLGMRILTGALNEMDGVWCERVYAPWPDMEEEMRRAGIPLFTLDSGDSVGDFDTVAFTLQYELCYSNVLNMLELAGIPLLSRERSDSDPVILAGGPCAYNPEPLADFVDIFSVGEGEEALPELAALQIEMKKSGNYSREEFLRAAAQLDGFYVPSVYSVEYNDDGTIASFEPKYADVPRSVMKRIVAELDSAYVPTAPVLPYIETVHDRITLEVFRGCIRGCRFCQAGFTNRPVREKSPDRLCELARETYENSGYDEISLSSLSISDYSRVNLLTEKLLDWTEERGVGLSLPSLRADSFTDELMNRIASVRTTTLTFAPEAGSQRLRDIINKNVTEEEILDACRIAFRAGKNQVKLYFMIGLPGESDEDVLGIIKVAHNVIKEFYKNPDRNRKLSPQVTISVACFIPKPGTPFQWEAQDTMDELVRKQKLLLDTVKAFPKIRYNYHDADVSYLEAVFARGNRRVGDALLEAHRRGIKFDAWREYFSLENWLGAFSAVGVDPDFFACRQFGENEILPWDMIETGVSREFMLAEKHKAEAAMITEDCLQKCSLCGAHRFGCGRYCAGNRGKLKDGDENTAAASKAHAEPHKVSLTKPPIRTVHIGYRKTGDALFIGHLDLQRIMGRAVVRAEIPVWFSAGFNPHPKLVFAAPLSVGIGGEDEYMEIRLTDEIDDSEVVARLASVTPPGIEITSCETAVRKFADIRRHRNELTVSFSSAEQANAAGETIEKMLTSPLMIMKKSKSGERECDMTAMIRRLDIKVNGRAVTVTVDTDSDGRDYLNPEYIAKALRESLDAIADIDIKRIRLIFEGEESR